MTTINVKFTVKRINVVFRLGGGGGSGGGSYILPTASSTVKGGVIIGDGLSIDDDGVLRSTGGSGGGQLYGGAELEVEGMTGRSTTNPPALNYIWYGDTNNNTYSGINWNDSSFNTVKIHRSSSVLGEIEPNSIVKITASGEVASLSNFIIFVCHSVGIEGNNIYKFTFQSSGILETKGTMPTGGANVILRPIINNLISNQDVIDDSINIKKIKANGTIGNGKWLVYNSGQDEAEWTSAVSSLQIANGAVTDTKISPDLSYLQKLAFRQKIGAQENGSEYREIPIYDNLNNLRNNFFGYYTSNATGKPTGTGAGFIYMYNNDQVATELSTGKRFIRGATTTVRDFTALTNDEINAGIPEIASVADMRSLPNNDGSNYNGVKRFGNSTPNSLRGGLVNNVVVARNDNYFIAVEGLNYYHTQIPSGESWTNLTWVRGHSGVFPNDLIRGDFTLLRSGMGWIILVLDNKNNHNISWIGIERPDGDIRAFGVDGTTFVGTTRDIEHASPEDWDDVQLDTVNIKDNAITLAKINAGSGDDNQFLQRSGTSLRWATGSGGSSTDNRGGKPLQSLTLARQTSDTAPEADNRLWFGTTDQAVLGAGDTNIDSIRNIKIKKDGSTVPIRNYLEIGSRIRFSSTNHHFIVELSVKPPNPNDIGNESLLLLVITADDIIYKSSGAVLETGNYTVTFKASAYDMITEEDIEGDSIDTKQIKDNAITDTKINNALTDAQKLEFRRKINISEGIQDVIFNTYDNLDTLLNGDYGFYPSGATNKPSDKSGIVWNFDNKQKATEIDTSKTYTRTNTVEDGSYSDISSTNVNALTEILNLTALLTLNTSTNIVSKIGRFTSNTAEIIKGNLSTGKSYIVANNGNYFIAVSGREYYHAKVPTGGLNRVDWFYQNFIDTLPTNYNRAEMDQLRSINKWVIITLDELRNKNISWIASETSSVVSGKTNVVIKAYGVTETGTFVGVTQTRKHTLGSWSEEVTTPYELRNNNEIFTSENYEAFSSIGNDLNQVGDVILTNPSGVNGYKIKINPKTIHEDKFELLFKQGYQIEITFSYTSGGNSVTNTFKGIITNNPDPNNNILFKNREFIFDIASGFSATAPTLESKESQNDTSDIIITEIKSNGKFVSNDLFNKNVIALQNPFAFAVQSSNLGSFSGTSWNNFNFTTPSIQIMDKANSVIELQGSGVVYFGTSTSIIPIGVELRGIYGVSDSENSGFPTFSTGYSVVPYTLTTGTSDVFFRSKIASGGDANDGTRYMDYSPTATQTINASVLTINDGQWVRFAFSIRKPSSDHQNIDHCYGWRVRVEVKRKTTSGILY